MTGRDVLALVPVNRLDRAKGRLATRLSPSQREALALATLRTVLDALAGAAIEAVVLTADERVRLATGTETRVMPEDGASRGLNAQLEGAIRRLAPPPAGVLILHADLPLATGAALRSLLACAPPARSATLVRSRDGGTNAMLLRPAGGFALAYGRGSFAAHEASARTAGFAVAGIDLPELTLDLDTPGDIEVLLASPEGRESAAGRLLAAWR